MSVKSAQAVTVLFSTANATTGAAADADSTPVGTLYVNGTANGATVTVTKITTGVYKAALTLPSLSAGDVVSLRVAATVGAVAGEGVVWQDTADTKRTSDLADEVIGTGAGLTAIGDTRLGNLDAAITTREASGAAASAAGSVTLANGAHGGAAATLTLQTPVVATISGTLTTLDALWAKIQKWLRLALRKDAAIATDAATELAEINANGGSGAGNYANTSESNSALASAVAAIPTTAAAAILATPDNKLATDASGRVTPDTVTAAGPDEDTIATAVDDALTLTHGAGAWGAEMGAFSKVYTVTVGGVVKAGAYCRLCTDLAGTNSVSAGTTNSLGQVTFKHNLPAGTDVWVHVSLDGYEPLVDAETI